MPSNILKIMSNLKNDIVNHPDWTYEKMADKLEIAEKTLFNWLNHPEKYQIPLLKFEELCALLGKLPFMYFPNCPTLIMQKKLDSPETCEEAILDIEKSEISLKRVFTPLWSGALWDSDLVNYDYNLERIHYTTKNIRRVTPEYEDFCKKRSNNFEKGDYCTRQIIYQHDFELWIRNMDAYKQLSDIVTESVSQKDKPKRIKDDIQKQLTHVMKLLEGCTDNNEPRLELRITKLDPYIQYAIFETSDNRNEDLVLINTNNGVMQIKHPQTTDYMKNEFDVLWDSKTNADLRTQHDWQVIIDALLSQDHILNPEFSFDKLIREI